VALTQWQAGKPDRLAADPEIPDARASGFIFPIPAKPGFPISRIRDSGQIECPISGIPAKSGCPISRNPGFRPNRDSNPGKSRFFLKRPEP
jgi:hypothetical protein